MMKGNSRAVRTSIKPQWPCHLLCVDTGSPVFSEVLFFFVSKAMGTPVLAVYFLLHTACGSLSR